MNRFEKFVRLFSIRMDQILFRLVITLLFILVVSQILLSNLELRSFLSQVDRLEGQPLDIDNQPVTPENIPVGVSEYKPLIITLALEKVRSLPEVKILIDGQVAGDFSSGEVVISPAAGQSIEIDATEYEENVSVYVASVSSNVASPTVGYKVVAYGTNELIGFAVPVK